MHVQGHGATPRAIMICPPSVWIAVAMIGSGMPLGVVQSVGRAAHLPLIDDTV